MFPGEDLAVITHINISFAKSDQIFSKIIQAVLDAPNPDLSRRPTDAAILKAAVGVYEPPAGFLTSFRIIRGVGRIQITEKDGELELRTRRGALREGVRMVPTDSSDPAFFSLDTGAPEPPGLVLTFDDNKAVTGLHMSRMNLVRNNNLQPWVS